MALTLTQGRPQTSGTEIAEEAGKTPVGENNPVATNEQHDTSQGNLGRTAFAAGVAFTDSFIQRLARIQTPSKHPDQAPPKQGIEDEPNRNDYEPAKNDYKSVHQQSVSQEQNPPPSESTQPTPSDPFINETLNEKSDQTQA